MNGNWQPIETAPKRGERVLLWMPKTNVGVVIGRWYVVSKTAEGEIIEDWIIDGFQKVIWGDGEYAPQGWQPLPAPPKGGDAQ